MEAKDIKWCPQHGYPLPCYKCGMPLSDSRMGDRMEIKVGITQDFATRKVQIVNETIDGKYVCKSMPIKMETLNLTYYWADSNGIFLLDKSRFSKVYTEEVG